MKNIFTKFNKKYIRILISISLIFLFSFTITSATDETWTQVTDLPGNAREQACSFSDGTYGYITLGDDGVTEPGLIDLWRYNPATNTYTQMANFIGTGRSQAITVVIGDTSALTTTGINLDTYAYFNDTYIYYITNNTWVNVADFPGAPRSGAMGFSIGTNVYIGSGYDGSLYQDWYKYDTLTNTWTATTAFGGGDRYYGTGFSINNKGYVGLGRSEGPLTIHSDIWEFDPIGETWTEVVSDTGVNLDTASHTIKDNIGYIGTGYDGSSVSTSMFMFDPSDYSITTVEQYPGNAIRDGVAFTASNRMFFGTGYDGSYYKTMYELTPPVTPTPTATEPPIAAPAPVLPAPFPTPIPPVPPIHEPILIIIEEFIDFVSTSYNWIFILLAYLGALIPKIPTKDETQEILVDTALYGTIGWILVLILNIFIPIISTSELLSMIIFLLSGLILSALSTLNSEPEKKKPRRKH